MTGANLEELRHFIDNLNVLDTHEHFRYKGGAAGDASNYDIFALLGSAYVAADFNSAGLKNVFSSGLSAFEKWKEIEKVLPFVRSTSYFRSLFDGLKELYGFEEVLSASNWQEYDRVIREHHNDSSWFSEVLNKAGIERYLNDEFWALKIPEKGGKDIPVLRINPFVMSALGEKDHNGHNAREFAEKQGVKIKNLDDYINWVDRRIGDFKKAGAVALKNALAYDRSLYFAETTEKEAKKIFKAGNKKAAQKQKTALQDFLLHRIMELAVKHGLPVQIHTGIQHGGGRPLAWSDPLLLNNLFLKYEEARFDVFHTGYPFTGSLIVLAKSQRNVFFNLCWMPIISETSTGELLNELLDCVPSNKIFWGGDCSGAELAYGAVRYAKKSIFRALAKRIENEAASLEDAKFIAKNILYSNAKEFYRI